MMSSPAFRLARACSTAVWAAETFLQIDKKLPGRKACKRFAGVSILVARNQHTETHMTIGFELTVFHPQALPTTWNGPYAESFIPYCAPDIEVSDGKWRVNGEGEWRSNPPLAELDEPIRNAAEFVASGGWLSFHGCIRPGTYGDFYTYDAGNHRVLVAPGISSAWGFPLGGTRGSITGVWPRTDVQPAYIPAVWPSQVAKGLEAAANPRHDDDLFVPAGDFQDFDVLDMKAFGAAPPREITLRKKETSPNDVYRYLHDAKGNWANNPRASEQELAYIAAYCLISPNMIGQSYDGRGDTFTWALRTIARVTGKKLNESIVRQSVVTCTSWGGDLGDERSPIVDLLLRDLETPQGVQVERVVSEFSLAGWPTVEATDDFVTAPSIGRVNVRRATSVRRAELPWYDDQRGRHEWLPEARAAADERRRLAIEAADKLLAA